MDAFEKLVEKICRDLGAPVRAEGMRPALLPEGGNAFVTSDAIEALGPAARDLPGAERVAPAWATELESKTPAQVLLCAATLRQPLGSTSTGVLALEQNLAEAPANIDPADEKNVRKLLLSLPMRIRGDDLALVFVPTWFAGESAVLSGTRQRLVESGSLRRVVALPGFGTSGTIGGLLVLVLQRPSTEAAPPMYVQPILLQRLRGPDEQVGWAGEALASPGTRWDRAVSSPDLLALKYLAGLADSAATLDDLETPVYAGTVDPQYLDVLLGQFPYVRAIARREPKIPIPVPPREHQRELVGQLRSGIAEAYEIACLLQNRDPRDGEYLGRTDGTLRMRRYMDRLILVDPTVRRVLGFLQRFFPTDGDDTRAPYLGWSNQLYARLAEAATVRADAESTTDLGLRVALLTSALVRLDAAPPTGRLDRILLSTARRDIAKARAEAIGTPTIEIRPLRARTVDGDAEVHFGISNRGRTTLFAAEATFTCVAHTSMASAAIGLLEPNSEEHVTVTFGALPPGEHRMEIRWRGRNVLGDDVKGSLGLVIGVSANQVELEDIDDLVEQHRWDAVADLASRPTLNPAMSAILTALLRAREGDAARAAAALLDGASRADVDEVPLLALLACLFGRQEAALEMAERAWRIDASDGDLALLLGRLRFWHGRRSAAQAVLVRAIEELTTEAHGILTMVLLSQGKTEDATDQLRGVEMDDYLRIALIPAYVMWGRTAEADAIIESIPRFATVQDEDVAWVVLDLLKMNEAAWARRLFDAWRGGDAALLGELVRALLLDAEGNATGRDERLTQLFGTGHACTLLHATLAPDMPTHNPYIIGKPIRDASQFFGRTRELEQIKAALTGQLGVVLLEGERRTGKTSLLNRVKTLLPPTVVSAELNLQGLGSISDASDVWRALGREVRRARGWSLERRRAAAETSTYEELVDVLDDALDGQSHTGMVLLIDEFEILDQANASGRATEVVPQLRHLMQTRPVGAVIAGAHGLARSRKEYRSPLFGFGTRVIVAELDVEAARSLVTTPSAPAVRWSDNAVERALELCDRQPFYLQHLCHQVFEARRARPLLRAVTISDVEESVEAVLQAAEEHLDGLLEALPSDLHRAILSRLAAEPSLGNGLRPEQLRDDVAMAFSRPASELEAAIDELADRGMIHRTQGGAFVRVAVLLLHQHAARRCPWEQKR
jgi:hypothetical protein